LIVSEQDLRAIRSGKVRKRVLTIPVERVGVRDARHPRTGRVLRTSEQSSGTALRKCPMRKGATYSLRAAVPCARYRQLASAEPTRARSVLRLYDLCEHPTVKPVRITVIEAPERQDDVWLVRFVVNEKADEHVEVLDPPIFLAKYGDYTMSASRQAIPGDPEAQFPFAEDLENARQRAREGMIAPQRETLARLSAEIDSCARVMKAMKARQLVKRAQRNLEAAERLLLSDASVDCAIRAAADGPQGEDGRPHRGASLATPEAA
jgi:hypothetical protein